MKKDEIEEEIELLKKYTSHLKDTVAAAKEAEKLGVDISKITEGKPDDGSD